LLSRVLRLSNVNIESQFLEKLRLIVSYNGDNRINYFSSLGLEIFDDNILDYERELPVHMREDTGFKLGKLIRIQSYFPEIYLFYKLDSDEVVIIDYFFFNGTNLVLINVNTFLLICEEWLEFIKNNNNL
jgi:hypothetical protein